MGKSSDAASGAAKGAGVGSAFGPAGTVVGGILGGAAGYFGSDDEGKEYDRFIDRSTRADEDAETSAMRRRRANNALTNILMRNIMKGQGARFDLAQEGLMPGMDQITSGYEGAKGKLAEGSQARSDYRLGRPVDESFRDPIESLAPDMSYLTDAKLPDFQTKLPNFSDKSPGIADLTPDQEAAISAAMNDLGVGNIGMINALAAG